MKNKRNNLKRSISVCFVFISLITSSSAQYLEVFSTPNKGYKLSCANDLAGVNWIMTPWDVSGTCQTADLRDPTDYFNTTAGGVMESIDLDQDVCWESPLINISAAGTVSLAVDLSWVGFDIDVMAGGCLGDYIRVMYSINEGSYTMVPNVVGGNPCATIAYLFSGPPGPHNSSTTVTQGGITGNNLRIRVCVFTNANAEMVTIDNVSVPQTGVTLNCAQPVLTTAVKNIVCNGPNSGSIDLSVTGGTPGYTYVWSPGGATTQDISNLAAGTYTVTVTDAAMCSQTTSATVISSPIAQSAVTFPAACGASDGAIDLSVSGGNPGYTYAWTGGATTQDISGRPPGSYTVTVTDASIPACASTATYTIGTLTNGPYNETFSIPNKGYLVNQVNNFFGMRWTLSPWTFDEPPTGIGRDNGDYCQTTATGKLEMLDTDQDLCWISPELNISASGTVQFSVDLSWIGFDNEDYILVQYSINGGSFVTIPNAFGGGVGTIQYAFPSVDQNGSFTVTKTGLTGNKLQIKVCGLTNSQGDIATLDNVSIPQTVSLCLGPSVTRTITNVQCNGGNNGSILVTATEGTPGYNVSWSGPSNGNPAGTEISMSGGSYNIASLTAGTYAVTVTDANGLSATTSAMITQPSALMLSTSITNATCPNSANGAIDLTVSGGTPSYTYNWGGGILTQDRTNLSPGTYIVTVTDASMCTATTSATINAINPLGDAAFAYSNSGYCQAGTDPTPIIYGDMGGLFSAPVPVVINTTTGQIDVSASTIGGPYLVTYTTSGPCPGVATFSVSIVNCQPGTTLTDMLTIDNGTIGKADPNDRIKLTATISNTQSANYEGVQLTLNNDPRVTFVSNSFKSTPVAVNDSYTATMNTMLTILVGSGLLQNDFDDNIPGLNVTAFDPTSTQGGIVSVNPNGSFTYTPMTGFIGDDTFNYTITDTDMQTNSGTVKIHVQ